MMADAMDDYCAYYIRTVNLCEALKRLEMALNQPKIEVPGSEHDRVASVKFQDVVYRLPVFATLKPNTVDVYSKQEDIAIDLAIGDCDISIWSGVFAPVLEPAGGRVGLIDGVEVGMMCTRIWFDVDSQYSLITLDFLSQQRYGITEEYPLYGELHESLKEVCDYCLVGYDSAGIVWDHPPIPQQFLPAEYHEEEVDLAVKELIAHHSTLPYFLLDKWPVPESPLW